MTPRAQQKQNVTGESHAFLPFDLRSGEVILQTHRVKFTLFIQRILLIGILTTIGLGFAPYLDITFAQNIGITLIALVVWVFVFDEWTEWFERKRDHWILTNQRLILQNPDESDQEVWLNLADIHNVKGWLWWSLRVTAQDGRVTIMSFVGPVRAIRNSLRQAVRTAKGDHHDG
jgi:hypothetical protein